jgi:hypothetical protein
MVSLGIPFTGGQKCASRRASPEETTRWGGNHWVTGKLSGEYRSIVGRVVMPTGKNMDDALVEVFNQPDYLLCKWEEFNPNSCTINPPAGQRRIAAFKTGQDGRFCFRNLAPDNYELRISRDGQWNVVHYWFLVGSKNSRTTNQEIIIEMTLGD